MYTEYQPSRLLAPYIDNYWEFKGTPEYGMRIHILPDGCTDFIFTLGEAVSKVKEETLVMQPYRSYFVGPMTKYSELVTYAEFVHQFGVRFLPCGLSGFTKLPLHEFANYRISTNEMQAVFDSTFIERVCEQNDVRGRIQVVEEYLLAYLAHNYQPVDSQVAATGASCAITYLMGGNKVRISYAIKNMIGNITGMICDGAKPSCAMKVSSGVSTAMLSALMAMEDKVVTSVEGIIDEDVDKSIANLTAIGSKGMEATDRLVLDIMTGKSC